MRFKDKTVVISGGTKGIGAACATLFYDEGANVIVLDIEKPFDFETKANWHYQNCNIAKGEEVREAFSSIKSKFDHIDYLINNAGIQKYGSVTETSESDWDLVFDVNLKGAFLCAQNALPLMVSQKKGVIINVASVQAFVSQQKVAAYTTAKTAMLGLTRSIAIDYAPYVRCVAVCPGTINTPMVHDSIALSPNPDEVMQECVDMHLTNRIGEPTEVAELIAFLCEDKASFITGEAIRIDGGLGISIGGSKKDI
ncbi:SDR family oxidoreductase [Litoribacter populi]|uniref:SDR family oxidoreductase n=1 Tax=Litoribacter populi TaxID=2598460 RepID=UPI00117CC7E7|nr:SDR family oxidoreductase [Litoribacter populi]